VETSLEVVADRFTLIPAGSGTFALAAALSIDRDGYTVFLGVDADRAMGLFVRSGDVITRIVDQITPAPGGTGTFDSFGGGFSGATDMDDGTIVFGATVRGAAPTSVQRHGIYRYHDGTITKVIDDADPVPGMPGRFFKTTNCGTEWPGAFHEISYHGGHTVFVAFIEPDEDDCDGDWSMALFTDLGGTFVNLVASGDVLDGLVVNGVFIGSDPIKDREIGFMVQFTDGSTANYLATYEPAPTLVSVDVKPGDSGNAVNPRSRGRLPVAILTSLAFDAARVDAASVTFGPGNATAFGRGSLEDVDADGDLDLLLHFSVPASGIACGETRVSLAGATLDGRTFTGWDTITTVGCR
jgi:hypothetical protein